MSSLQAFIIFICAALVWVWVLPIWQGPDETAHFSYVQYMVYHKVPPKVETVPPGYAPWRTSQSHALMVSRKVTQYNRILTDPAFHMRISPEMRERALGTIRDASNVQTNRAGTQNYVGIYPPLYYGVVGNLLHISGVQNVVHQGYIARFCSVFIFGVFGVVAEMMLWRVIPNLRWRSSLLISVPLLFPTLSMLGGVVNNDILMDTMSLGLFCVILDALHRKVWSKTTAVGYGLVIGLSLIAKPDTYILVLITGFVILCRLVRSMKSIRNLLSFAGVCSVPAFVLSVPWFLISLRYYHSIIPPLTYQAAGTWPRNANWFMSHLLQSPLYQRSIMVYQTVSGINFPWWTKPVPFDTFYNAWILFVGIAILYGAYRLFRNDKAVFIVSVVWITSVYVFLWYITYNYLLKTGMHFLQGRYFFMMLPVVIYLLANALRSQRWILRFMPLFSGVIFITVINATAKRYYGSGIISMTVGDVLTYDPSSVIVLGRVSFGLLCLLLFVYCCLPTYAKMRGGILDLRNENNHEEKTVRRSRVRSTGDS